MKYDFKKLVILACVFCLVFCGVSAEQLQKEQNFNTVLQEVLVGTPDIEVPQQFQSVAFKTITISETLKKQKSQQFSGVRVLRDVLGDNKRRFDTTFVYLSKDKPIVAQGFCGWCVSDTPNSGLQYKLYYQKNPVTAAMDTGDLLFLGKVDSERLLIVVVNRNSPVKDKLLASFSEKPATNSDVVTLPLQIEPAASWYKVYFTPGFDCENNIISRLNNAKNNIDIAVYSITNRNIVDAILAAHKRGVKVRVMTDNMQEKGTQSLVKELVAAGIPVRTNINSNHKIEHNKFAIFDGKDMESGSYNWTNNATKSNSENCMFFCQTGKDFSNRYEYLWKLYD